MTTIKPEFAFKPIAPLKGAGGVVVLLGGGVADVAWVEVWVVLGGGVIAAVVATELLGGGFSDEVGGVTGGFEVGVDVGSETGGDGCVTGPVLWGGGVGWVAADVATEVSIEVSTVEVVGMLTTGGGVEVTGWETDVDVTGVAVGQIDSVTVTVTVVSMACQNDQTIDMLAYLWPAMPLRCFLDDT